MKALRKVAITVCWLVGLVYLAFVLGLYLMQRDFLYHPTLTKSHPFGSLDFLNDGLKIRSLFVNPGQEQAIVYYGGNAENMADAAQIFAHTDFEKYTIYLLEYRGFGQSEGQPSEEGIIKDALSLFDLARSQHDKVTVIGRSIGTGPAVQVAAQREAENLILVTPYDSILSIAQRQYPFAPVQWLLKDTYRSDIFASDVSERTLVLTSEVDRVIPHLHTHALISAFKKEPETVMIQRANHDNIVSNPMYIPVLVSFLQRNQVN